MSAIKPYNLANLVVGSVRVLWAPISAPVPTKIQDVFAMTDPYTPVSPWTDLGAQKSASQYSRDINVQGNEIQQETGNVFEEVTAVDRKFKVSIAELTPETMQIIENAPDIETIAAAAGASAQKGLAVGTIAELVQYRIFFVGLRKAAYGAVIEPSGAQRGRLVAYVGYRAAISADAVNEDFDKGNLVEAPVTFDTFPEPGQPSGKEYGKWLFEDAGTIT